MVTEAVQDGGQAMRDPVGGSVEFHFVPILKLVSTLLIMGVFDDNDVKHILKMIEPTVFSSEEPPPPPPPPAAETKENPPRLALKAPAKKSEEEDEEEEYTTDEEEYEEDDEGVGEEDEYEGEDEMDEVTEQAAKVKQVNGEKGAEETEKEVKSGEAAGETKEVMEQGLFQMKLPESVKLQVQSISRLN